MIIACVATGPSLTETQIRALKGIDTIVINDAYRAYSDARWLYACDPQWWNYHYNDVNAEFSGEMWTQDLETAEIYKLKYIESKSEPGLSRDSSYINQGFHSGYQAINLAVNFGASKILLLGYDMKDSQNHFFGKHPKELRRISPFNDFIRSYDALSNDLTERKIEVVNCTPQSAIHQFRLSTIERETTRY